MWDPEFLAGIWGGDSRWLWMCHWWPPVMEALGLTVQKPVAQPEPPAVPLPGANEDDWTCWNAKNVQVYVWCFLIASAFSPAVDWSRSLDNVRRGQVIHVFHWSTQCGRTIVIVCVCVLKWFSHVIDWGQCTNVLSPVCYKCVCVCVSPWLLVSKRFCSSVNGHEKVTFSVYSQLSIL